MNTSANREALRRQRLTDFIHRIWNEGDAKAASDFIADSYTIHHDPGDPWEGMTLDLAGFRDRIVQSRAAFPDQCFDIQGVFANGDGLVLTWLWSGTHQAELAGFAPTGKTVRMSGATAYFFDANDRLTGHWQVADRLGVFQQLQLNAQASG